MTRTAKVSILYFFMAAVLIMALITIRPATKSSPPPENPASDLTSAAANIPKQPSPTSLFELKLSGDILLFTTYGSDGNISQQKTIDYIDIYSLYPEQLQSLQKGIFFKSRESAAEFIQDLGS